MNVDDRTDHEKERFEKLNEKWDREWHDTPEWPYDDEPTPDRTLN